MSNSISRSETIEGQVEAVKLEDADLPPNKMQTFVFSATMSKDLQKNLKRRRQLKGNVKSGSTIGWDNIGRISKPIY